MIDQGATLSVKRQCELLGLNWTGVYYTPRPIPEQDLRPMRRIDELHLEHPFYGARRLARQLEREVLDVDRLHVTTLMRRMVLRRYIVGRGPASPHAMRRSNPTCSTAFLSRGPIRCGLPI